MRDGPYGEEPVSQFVSEPEQEMNLQCSEFAIGGDNPASIAHRRGRAVGPKVTHFRTRTRLRDGPYGEEPVPQ
jgi:hypothetical protein